MREAVNPIHDTAALTRRMSERCHTLGTYFESISRQSVTEEEWLDILARLGQDLAWLQRIGARVATSLGLPRSARSRVLLYLQHHIGQTVDGDQLDGVAGIRAAARRLRELRATGWDIASNKEDPHLKPGQYQLRSGRKQSSLNSGRSTTDSGR
jgi:hypothetical protein